VPLTWYVASSLNSLSLVTVNRNQAGAFFRQLLYHLDEYGLHTKRLRRTFHTVVFNIDGSLAAVPVDFFGLCTKLARTRSTSSSAVNGRLLDFCLQTSSFSKLFIPRMNFLVCRRVLCVLCTKCSLHSNHRLTRVIFQHTKRLLSRSGHFLTTYTRIA
jgi:hypothetical protein